MNVVPTDHVPARKTIIMADRLADAYGHKSWHAHNPPIDELVATILSQHTSDLNTERAFRSLRERFSSWDAVASAPVNDVATVIRCGGLANIKAKRIQSALREAETFFSDADLSELRELTVSEARARLCQLTGVGPKTASCVLLFGLGIPANPVDTHIHRVSSRVGIIPPKTTANSSHEIIEAALGTDLDTVYAFHVNSIMHGRLVCKSRTPRCSDCVLLDICNYGKIVA